MTHAPPPPASDDDGQAALEQRIRAGDIYYDPFVNWFYARTDNGGYALPDEQQAALAALVEQGSVIVDGEQARLA